MENEIIMHLITVATLALMAFIIIGIPWLVGLAINRIIDIDEDCISTWLVGIITMMGLSIVIFFIYFAYTDIFNFYTKH